MTQSKRDSETSWVMNLRSFKASTVEPAVQDPYRRGTVIDTIVVLLCVILVFGVSVCRNTLTDICVQA